MEQVFALMIGLGGMSFIIFGMRVGNSIEAKNSNLVANVLTAFSVIGMFSFIIGLIGLLILK
jgi:hypothetical protein